ncbi:acyltransferase [Gallaecimonas pentaromativorans]|uniref:acyltransferase n=1 Tax=Gallaecimonas pentaromativorans TaxID=584787 RepID=UPI001E459E7F|nr:acyltransferase [Gallaecimonas pentaromativorans]
MKPENFSFGDGISINEFVYINATGGVVFGNNVILSSGVKILSTGLVYGEPPYKYASSRILIGDNVQIGAAAIVLPGVSIVDNVIVGAGSIVTKDLTEPGVYIGSPAKIIRK